MSSITGLEKSNANLVSRVDFLEGSIKNQASKIREDNATISQLQEEVGFCRSPPSSCRDFNFPTGRHSAILSVNNMARIFKLICEVDDQGKVWTIFHRRFDGSVSFHRNFSDYENGFGSTDGEFWLGLKNIKALMGNRSQALRLSMKKNSISYEDNYLIFSLSDGPKYTLSVDRDWDNGASIMYNNGQDFSTFDYGPSQGCAQPNHGGWWYRTCTYIYMNGVLGKNAGVTWWNPKQNNAEINLTEAELKFSD